VGILLLLVITILAPVLASHYIHGRLMYEPMALVSLLLVLILTCIYFIFIESIFLLIFGVNASISGLAHSVCYSMPPVIFILWIMYVANYCTTGTISFVTFAMTGYAADDDPFIKAAPVILNIGFCVAFFVFFRAIKLMGDMFNTNAVIIGVLSIFPFHVGLILAVITANFIHPGTSDTFIQLIYAPATLIVGGNQ
jgi:hypothetical protein